MQATADWIACCETADDCEETGEETNLIEPLLERLKEVRDRVAEFDAALDHHLDLLETVARRPSFEAWRECLADEFYFSVAPWITRLLKLPPPANDLDSDEDDSQTIVEAAREPSSLQSTLQQIVTKTTMVGSPAPLPCAVASNSK